MKINARKTLSLICSAIVVIAAVIYLLQAPHDTASDPAASAGASVSSSAAAPTGSGVSGLPARLTADDLAHVPAYSGAPYIEINGNRPSFTQSDYTTKSYEYYSDLDALGRCGEAIACIGKDLMPTEARGDIGSVKPSGWRQAKYDFVDGKSLYNRCHLIGYQLTAENANAKNLITGTRYFNVIGMLPFENMAADYIKETGNHVLYRVTPLFAGDNPVAAGVQMEAWSVEDNGEGVCYNVFVYNNQPGVAIDYATGESHADGTIADGSVSSAAASSAAASAQTKKTTYILNTKTHKFHLATCPEAAKIDASVKKTVRSTHDALVADGYSPCGRCKP